MITIIESGSILNSTCQCITCTVNLQGVMGAGIAKAFKHHFPGYYTEYVEACKQGALGIGNLMLHSEFDPWILSFPTKNQWIYPSEMSYIEEGLDDLVNRWGDWGLTSLALPALGCTNGRLDWREVRALIESYLEPLMLDVHLYTPWAYLGGKSNGKET